MTLAEVLMILGAKRDQREADVERDRALNYEMAVLTSYAYHAPRKMPKYKPQKAPKGSDDLAQAQVRGFFIGLAMQKKG